MLSPSRLAFVASIVAGLALVACSSAPTTTASNSAADKSSTSAKEKGSTSGSDGSDTSRSSSSTPSGEAPDSAKCAAEQTYDACDSCCTGGNDTVFEASSKVYMDCVCGASGVCKTECAADFCQGTKSEPSQACQACLDAKEQTCLDKADQACEGDAACKVASACEQAAKCSDKN